MIISRTPFRISFFGGGSDYPVWFREYGGSVLGTTIDKYCYITCRTLPPFFEYKHRIVYSQSETVKNVDEIHHPGVREIMKFMNWNEGLEVHHDGDLPARTGLGTSSSFTVGFLNTLYAMKGQMVTKMQLAKEAIHIEQDLRKENVGCQDQTMAAFGGFNRIDFRQNGEIEVRPVITNRLKELESCLMLIFTGFSRTASEIAAEQIAQTVNHKQELNEMCGMVDEAVNILNSDKDIGEFGKLLNRSWQLKRSLSNGISNAYIDFLYDTALKNGALGGKILGAGGGGFMAFFVLPEARERVIGAMCGVTPVDFHFDNTGSQIIFYEHD